VVRKSQIAALLSQRSPSFFHSPKTWPTESKKIPGAWDSCSDFVESNQAIFRANHLRALPDCQSATISICCASFASNGYTFIIILSFPFSLPLSVYRRGSTWCHRAIDLIYWSYLSTRATRRQPARRKEKVGAAASTGSDSTSEHRLDFVRFRARHAVRFPTAIFCSAFSPELAYKRKGD
jgi:hypothetical protein